MEKFYVCHTYVICKPFDLQWRNFMYAICMSYVRHLTSNGEILCMSFGHHRRNAWLGFNCNILYVCHMQATWPPMEKFLCMPYVCHMQATWLPMEKFYVCHIYAIWPPIEKFYVCYKYVICKPFDLQWRNFMYAIRMSYASHLTSNGEILCMPYVCHT